ncbi:class I poly(R)-hydroxyalkanoic acid synthase [Caulobacter sp. S45]|uniref:class I poly(R)-hydroxyalkanoic acid synthase n=1 Tax=Caulobacter sp. S45 TaxID=1641861 RepID=UPI0015755FC3|nr:class I poly(R)-hydroxyalkanoic acid synthase [Caulobacter sp. S45]
MDDAAPPPSAAQTADGAPNPDVRQEPRDPSLTPPPASGPEPAPSAFGLAGLDLLTPEQRRTLEQLSLNLSQAAATVQSAITGAAARQGGSGEPPNPDPFHVAPAMAQVVQSLASSPDKLMKAQANLFERYVDLWRVTAARAAGETAPEVVAAPKGDKRFNDADWSENPVFDVMKQSYLVTSGWLNELVAGAEGIDPLAKRRVAFFTKLLTDAFSPSNYLATNPSALKALLETQGESLLKGAQRFAEDIERGGGKLAISQTDYQKFKVGENVATAPGKVVFQNDLFQLLQFSPTTEQVQEIPLLIFPPWINKYYILDLKPENSMIRWLTGQGFTVFLTSWVNPGPALAGKTLENYVFEGAYTAIAQVLGQSGATQVNTVGYCIGGTMLACAMAHMAKRGLDVIASATFFAAQQDFAEAGDLMLFVDDAWLADLEKMMDAADGVLPSAAMADTFNMLRANDLIWSFFVNNYLMGKEPAAFDLLFWNSDQTRMPKALHLGYLRQFYQNNLLSKGELKLGGVTLDLKAVHTPVYVQSSREDHIAPMRSVYRGAKLFGGPVRFTLAGSGHIAGVINPPSAHKYQHWVNTALPQTVEDWLAEAEEHKGSWWPDWAAWLAERSGGKVPARDPAAGPLPVIEDAPGSYVKVKS